jgi:hypothetical protein
LVVSYTFWVFKEVDTSPKYAGAPAAIIIGEAARISPADAIDTGGVRNKAEKVTDEGLDTAAAQTVLLAITICFVSAIIGLFIFALEGLTYIT